MRQGHAMESREPARSAEPEFEIRVIEVAPGLEAVRDRIVEELKTVYDPEIPVDIFELGLVYSVKVDAEGAASVRLTLTSPMCPVAEELPPEVESKIRGVEGISSVALDLVWDPPWNPGMMTEAAKLELGML